MNKFGLLLLFSVLVTATMGSQTAARGRAGAAVPYADYHQHLFSPEKAKAVYEPPLATIDLPADLATVIAARERAWHDTARLSTLFTKDATLLNTLDDETPSWLRGNQTIAKELVAYFDDPYRITPVSCRVDGNTAIIAAYYTRGKGDRGQHVAHGFFALIKDDGQWKIAAENPVFPGPPHREPSTSEQLIAQLDEAGIRKAVVLSVAYQWGASWECRSCAPAEQYAKVRAENDYVEEQVSKHPDRLIGFCSFNPLKAYALEELERCSKLPHMHGLKLHFGNSEVDIRKAEDAAKVIAVFRAANAKRLPIVVHLWTDPQYETEGGQYAKVFLEQILPAAPDVVVQIAHLAGGGRSTPTALKVFADAISRRDPRTKNLYFDVATATQGETAEGLRRDADFIRQIGPERILYGTDTAPPNPPARVSWGMFRGLVPLSDEEFRIIAANVAPYLR